ncbi:hypothetical protein D3C78_1116800 [compost metagenome]
MTAMNVLRCAFILQLIHFNRGCRDYIYKAVKKNVIPTVNIRAPMIGQANGFMNMHTEHPLLHPIGFLHIVIQAHALHHHAMADIVP